MSLLDIIRTMLALIVIIWLANWALVKLNRYTQGQNKSIKIIERFSISKNSSIAIVKVMDEYYLMSLSEGKNEILKEFSKAEAYEIAENLSAQNNTDPALLLKSFDLSKWKEKYTKFFNKNEKK